MPLPKNKTKIVCTIGPATDTQEMIEQLLLAGMNVARLNFSHGNFDSHKSTIGKIRAASRCTDRPVAVMADLPGPKMRIGRLSAEPIELKAGSSFTLTTEEIVGDAERASMSFPSLPQVVQPGDTLYLNDGIIELNVEAVSGSNVRCTVVVGGELRSHKGLNLPGIKLGISAFTEHDQEVLRFAQENGVDAVSQSFVETAADVDAVRRTARSRGYDPFVIAKIERLAALENLDGILQSSDGIMIARGDLGVEIPIQRIAAVQKDIMRRANALAKPVITATQMLESMTLNRRPTRAEATDVANAILDGTDCVMLSGESATGRFPVEAAAMLAKIAAAIEPLRRPHSLPEGQQMACLSPEEWISPTELISFSVENAARRIHPAAVIVPTRSGHTARSIARFRLPTWITGVSSQKKTIQDLLFSSGVHPVLEPEHPAEWNGWVKSYMEQHDLKGDLVLLTEGPSRRHPHVNNRMEVIDLRKP